MKVLVITRSDDGPAAPAVIDALRSQGGEPIRFDTDLYPLEVRVSSRVGGKHPARTLRVGDVTTPLIDVDAVWYRRFYAGGTLPDSLGDLLEPSVNEARRAAYGMIASIDAFQMDPLSAVRRCDHKELQLQRAAALGLAVPETLITNDPQEALAFFKTHKGRIVTKMQNSFAVHRGGEEQVVFTTRVKREDLDELDGLALCPMMFQPLVPKRLELRTVVVGRETFTAAVDSQRASDTKVDWRRDGIGLIDAWKPYRLPKKVERALLALTESFGLNYAAADFILTPDGELVFLEINAGGEWFWLQRNPGLPIADAIAGVLLGRRDRVPSAV